MWGRIRPAIHLYYILSLTVVRTRCSWGRGKKSHSEQTARSYPFCSHIWRICSLEGHNFPLFRSCNSHMIRQEQNHVWVSGQNIVLQASSKMFQLFNKPCCYINILISFHINILALFETRVEQLLLTPTATLPQVRLVLAKHWCEWISPPVSTSQAAQHHFCQVLSPELHKEEGRQDQAAALNVIPTAAAAHLFPACACLSDSSSHWEEMEALLPPDSSLLSVSI